jgi:hypothetical protein
VGATTLPIVPQPTEDVVLYYPGRKLVERIRQYGARPRSNLDKAIGIIHHRVHPLILVEPLDTGV